MDDTELIGLIEAEESNCVSNSSGALAEQRRQAMRYYYGQPYGNEVEGRSEVVTTEVKDVVEGLLPIIMDIFTSSDEIVRCDPQGPEDEEPAQQATDWLNYKFSRSINGWTALFQAVKDALLQKNGYLKVYWEDYEDVHKETYNNLTEDEFQYLSQDPELELEEDEQFYDQSVGPQLGPDGVPTYPILHNAVFKRTKALGRICVDPVPPEEILVARDCPVDIRKARFVEHRTKKTISEIRQMGFKVDDDISDGEDDLDLDLERTERFLYDDSSSVDGMRSANTDPSTKTVTFREAYLYLDYDKDGIAEFRKVCIVGNKILDNVEFDSLPIISGTAVIMPHKHYGLGAYDLVGDIQLTKSTITRQLLDNAYQANNTKMGVLDGMVNMDDLLTSRPGGIVRMKAIGALQPMPPQLLGPSFYGLLEYFDNVKTSRTGAADFPGNGVDPDAINSKAAFVDAYKQAAMMRPALMARSLAETLVKPMFEKMLELGSKHSNKPEMMRLRGKWTPVDPRGWYKKFDLTVTVGLGTGNQQTVLQGAMGILQIQSQLAQMGLSGRVVTEGNLWAAAHRFAKAVFPKEADQMFTNPQGLPPPQPAPNPELIKIQEQARKADQADAFRKMQLQANMMNEEAQRRFEAVMESQKQQNEQNAEKMRAMLESFQKDRELRADIEKTVIKGKVDSEQSVIDAVTQLKVAEKNAQENQAQIILKGFVDQMLEAQKAQQQELLEYQKHLQNLAETMAAPRELVKDPKTGKKTVRIKKDD